jgi:hypothetical protein
VAVPGGQHGWRRKAVLSCFHRLIDNDRSLKQLADLPLGWWAGRTKPGSHGLVANINQKKLSKSALTQCPTPHLAVKFGTQPVSSSVVDY